MEIRRSYDRLISTMGFPILVRRHLYIESGPWFLFAGDSVVALVKYEHEHDSENLNSAKSKLSLP